MYGTMLGAIDCVFSQKCMWLIICWHWYLLSHTI